MSLDAPMQAGVYVLYGPKEKVLYVGVDLRKPEVGSAVWDRFGGRPKEDTLWYYREVANAFQDLLPGQLAEELMEIVIVLENE